MASTQCGPLLITGSGVPTQIQRDDGFWFLMLGSGGTLTNTGTAPVVMAISATYAESGNVVATLTQVVRLAGGQSFQLPPPPNGSNGWALTSARVATWDRLTVIGGVVTVAGIGLMGYGAWALGQDLRRRWQHRRRAR